MALANRMRKKKEKEQREKLVKLVAVVGFVVVGCVFVYFIYQWLSQTAPGTSENQGVTQSNGVTASQRSDASASSDAIVLTRAEEKKLGDMVKKIREQVKIDAEFCRRVRGRLMAQAGSGALTYAPPQLQRGYAQAEQMLDAHERMVRAAEDEIDPQEQMRLLNALYKQNGHNSKMTKELFFQVYAASIAVIPHSRNEIVRHLRTINIHF